MLSLAVNICNEQPWIADKGLSYTTLEAGLREEGGSNNPSFAPTLPKQNDEEKVQKYA